MLPVMSDRNTDTRRYEITIVQADGKDKSKHTVRRQRHHGRINGVPEAENPSREQELSSKITHDFPETKGKQNLMTEILHWTPQKFDAEGSTLRHCLVKLLNLRHFQASRRNCFSPKMFSYKNQETY